MEVEKEVKMEVEREVVSKRKRWRGLEGGKVKRFRGR